MSKKELLKLFDNKNIRVVWDDELQEWFFSVVDVVGALTDSKNPTDYLKKMRKREVELDVYLGTNCPQVLMTTPSGKRRKTLAGNPEHLFRIIQSIPSPKAEPFKRWMAQVAAERLDQLQDPELSIEQAVADYRRLGYSENWINQRLKSIEVRKLLTDEWKRGGVQGQQFASLTDIITAAWSGRTTKQYKHLKGLHKESLRDNMTNVELLLNSLAEASATEISKKENPKGYGQNADVAKRGGRVAKAARNQLESQLGHSVVTSLNAKDYFRSIEQKENDQLDNNSDDK
ncbi:MAG: Bro-N domain-containing protein [Prevotella sp.]|jgi:hypothetical protein|nr:Bro-N domain-containing protein [Prevotella sp.]